MTELYVDHKGFVFWQDVRLPLRYLPDSRMIEFVVRDREQRARHGAHITIPLDDIARLELVRLEGVKSRADRTTRT